MEYVNLTGTGLSVSRFCLGTMTFGAQMEEKDAIRAVDYALDQGINMVDTANKYANGKGEEILGKALSGGKREKVILATKAGTVAYEGPNGRGLSRRHIMEQINISLKRMKTDYLDIFYLHQPDYATPVEETLDTMDYLVRSGKVLYLGVSNFAAWQVARLYHLGKSGNKPAPVVAQMVYNLITRGIEQEFIPFTKEYRIGTIAYNPLAAGFLTDKYADKQKLENTRFALSKLYADRYWNEDNLTAWDAIHAIARQAAIPMHELAMRWIISTGSVNAILLGFSRMEQLESNIKALDGGPLSADVMEACDAVWKSLSGTRYNYNR
ncbi:Predicted aldo/keto reductase [uncultured delta proteobacterium]|uniref:Predicted aldo/keto reductase n=1 Tax=uncultured delta proteobacterium TaxID=34034 RepID=A0A212JF14_9DELT|nr:Predicted aldo/keto reductase [uncultured delta proteobacterium]